MSAWSDGLLRAAQCWMFYLSIGLPLFGVLLGGLCAVVRDRAVNEINHRQVVAAAGQQGMEAERRKREQTEADLRKTEVNLRIQLDQALKRAQDLAARQTPPRSITAEQRSKFIDLLEFSPKGKIHVSVTSGDPEATNYANQIRAMVGDAGYDVGAVVSVGSQEQKPQDVYMLVGHPQHPFAGAIQQALGTIGIGATGLIDNSIPADDVRIDVGARP